MRKIYLDFSMFHTFWKNPEEFRLTAPFLLNLKTKATKEYFGIGGFVHLMQEAKNKGWSPLKTVEMVRRKKLEPFEKYGMTLWNKLEEWNERFNATILESEATWSLALSDRFGMFGKIDEIWDVHGFVECQDTKTLGERWSTKEAVTEIQLEWENTIIGAQANFGLIGAGVIGYKPERFRVKCVCKITEKEPCPLCAGKISARTGKQTLCKHPKTVASRPEVFTTVIKRTPEELENFKREVKMTCSLIDHWINEFGFESPWPHIVQGKWSGYACGGRSKNFTCDLAPICGRSCTEIEAGQYRQFFETNPFYDNYFEEEE